MPRTSNASRAGDYLLACAVGALVVGLSALLTRPMEGVGYALATAAVCGVALLTGARAALACAAAVLAGSVAFVPGAAVLSSDSAAVWHLVTFVAAALAAIWMGASYRAARLRAADVVASISEGFVVVDRSGRFAYANDAAARMLGRSARGLVGGSARDLFPGAAGAREPFRRVMEERTPAGFDLYAPELGRWFDVRAYPLREGGMSVWFRDITRERETERRAAHLHEQMSALREANVVGIVISTLDGLILDANDYYLSLTAHTREELAEGRIRWGDRTSPEHRERDARAREVLRTAGRADSFEKELVLPDGTRRWVLVAGATLREPEEEERIVSFLLDISDRRRVEQDLRRSREVLEAIVESSTSPIYVKDASGRFLLVNSATARFLGRAREEILGRSDHDLLPPETASVFRAADLEVMETRLPREFEESVPREDGVHTYIASKFPVVDASGKVYGIGGLSTDVTALKRTEEALRERERALMNADRRKDDFLAVLSHELRNPLAPIRNGIVLLERSGPLEPKVRRVLQVVNRQIDHMTRLVDDLLDVTRITRGKIRMQRETVDLAALARREGQDLQSLFDRNRVSFHMHVPDEPVWVSGDEARLMQVVGNLLQNAAKFTPRNGRVTLSVERRGGAAVVRVEDTGIGIEPELLEKIFEPFSQADRSLDRTRGGLGLGLALARAIVSFHGGSIRAGSEGPGKGAVFTVTLPEAAAPPEAARPAGAERAEAPRPLNIVVVEDNRDAADTLRDLLEMEGHDVAVAYTGPHGLRLVRERRPDVVLCDVGLPEMDGYQVARAVKQDPALRSVHLVALTGYALPEDQRRAAEAGFETHLAKPPDFRKLGSVLASIVRAA